MTDLYETINGEFYSIQTGVTYKLTPELENEIKRNMTQLHHGIEIYTTKSKSFFLKIMCLDLSGGSMVRLIGFTIETTIS